MTYELFVKLDFLRVLNSLLALAKGELQLDHETR